MSLPAELESPGRIDRMVQQARRRLDRLAAEEAALACATPVAGALAVAGALVAVWPEGWRVAAAGAGAAAAVVAAGGALGWWRARTGGLAAAKRLDDALRAKDRVVSAWEFVRAGRTDGPYGLAVRDALEKLEDVDVPALLAPPPRAAKVARARLAALGAAAMVAIAFVAASRPGAPRPAAAAAGAAAVVGSDRLSSAGSPAYGPDMVQLRARLAAIAIDVEMRGWGPRGMAPLLTMEERLELPKAGRRLAAAAPGHVIDTVRVDGARGDERVVARRTAYRKLYAEKRPIVEAALYDETIPVSRKDYLRRYFEAIRPAE